MLMKKVRKIITVMLIMVIVVSAFVSIKLLDFSDDTSRINVTGELRLSDEEFSLGVGESYQCSAFLNDHEEVDNIVWSSSDPLVAKINDMGRVTAVSVGETEIRAKFSENIVSSAKMWVYDDPIDCTTDSIIQFASDGSYESFVTLANFARQFKCAKSSSVRNCSDLLNGLIKFSEIGAGDSASPADIWEQMCISLSDLETTDISQDTLRKASLASYCQGEKLVNDVTISFTGDCTFAYFNENDKANMFPSVYRNSNSITYPFDLTKNVFGADDITMINFEGTLTQSTEHKDKTFYFRGEPSYVNILTNSSVEAVTVENNHSLDYFDRGYNETLSHLRDANVRYTCYSSPCIINVDGYQVVMLSLSMVSSYYKPEFKSTIEKYINQYRGDKTVIIVNLHWGTEGASTPEAWQVETAHSIIDAGADMIIGHHPHVLQGIELYKGHYIAYSLGNFSFGGNMSALSPETIIFRASFTQDTSDNMTSRVSVVPCYTTSSGNRVNNFRPTPLFGIQGESVINKLLSLSAQLDGGITDINWNQVP